MTLKTVYPSTLTQTSESNTSFREFNNLNNLKNNNDTYAKTGQIASKSGTHKRPSAITATNFKANIPEGSKINKITVEYAADYEGNISIGKSTVNILNISGENKNGKALTKTMSKSSVSWSGNHAIANVNSKDFGVKISFPANTKADVGYVKIKYIRIIIDYTVPNYRVTASKVDGQYTNDNFKVEVTASNVNKTNGDSAVSIQLPSGVTYIGKDNGNGSVSASGSKIIWTPGLSSTTLTRIIVLNLKVTTDGNHNIKFTEAKSGHSTQLNLSSVQKPVYATVEVIDETPAHNEVVLGGGTEEPVTTENILYVTPGEMFSIDIYSTELAVHRGVGLASDSNGIWYSSESFDDMDDEDFEDFKNEINPEAGQWNYDYGYIPNNKFLYTEKYVQWFKIYNNGKYKLYIFPDGVGYEEELITYTIYVRPSENSLSTPMASIIPVTGEELSRMADKVVYTMQSYLKLVSSETYVRDWYKNFRIGVFNNRIYGNKAEIITMTQAQILINYPPLASKVLFKSTIPFRYKINNEGGWIMYNPEDIIEITSSCAFNMSQINDEDGTFYFEIYYGENIAQICEYPITVANGGWLISFGDENNHVDMTDYSNLSTEEIINNAEYYSSVVSKLNEYESLSVDFPYNADYPLYLVVTHDYYESNIENELCFTEPCLIESRVFKGWERNGNFPEPIQELLGTVELSDLSLDLFESSNTIVFDKFPLGENYSVTDTFAITGIVLLADVEFSDQLSVTAKLCKDNDHSGERSILVGDVESDNDVSTISIGGQYDLWGFNISDITNLEDWRVELSLNNIYSNADDKGEIKFNNIRLVVYSNKVKSNLIQVHVEDENVRHYGMFVNDVKIPEGVETDVRYISIDGTTGLTKSITIPNEVGI